MEFLRPIRDYIELTEDRTFYRYLILSLSCILLLCTIILVRFYHKRDSLRQELDLLYQDRETRVQKIITNYKKVAKQREAVQKMLSEKEQFELDAVVKSTLANLNLANKVASQRPEQIELDSQYNQNKLVITMTGMDMKSVAQLLKELEQKDRMYITSLEIIKSKKTPKTVDITLTVATLQPKS